MKLDRNINEDGRGKYGLIKNRRLAEIDKLYDGGDGDVADLQAIKDAIALLERAKVIDWGITPETEFFVIRLKDQHAQAALDSYAEDAVDDDVEYAEEVGGLALRAGPNHPNCKNPD